MQTSRLHSGRLGRILQFRIRLGEIVVGLHTFGCARFASSGSMTRSGSEVKPSTMMGEMRRSICALGLRPLGLTSALISSWDSVDSSSLFFASTAQSSRSGSSSSSSLAQSMWLALPGVALRACSTRSERLCRKEALGVNREVSRGHVSVQYHKCGDCVLGADWEAASEPAEEG